MLLPSTHQAAVLLLALSFVCLGSWGNLFKLARWRFELFYLDFALGALLLSAGAAFSLGTLGSELSFNDRIAVAGLRSQAFAISGGFVFSIGNMLLVAGISLTGMAVAFPLTLGIALIVSAGISFIGANLTFLIIGSALVLASVLASVMAAMSRNEVKPATQRQVVRTLATRANKGTAVAVIGGILIGIAYPLAEHGFWGDLGLGAYAGVLMFCLGLLASTALFGIFFMNMGIEGGRVAITAYPKGSAKQHALGVFSGVVWALGFLASLLAQSVPAVVAPAESDLILWTQGAVLLAFIWGLLAWKEFQGSTSRGKFSISLAALLFVSGLFVLAFRFQT